MTSIRTVVSFVSLLRPQTALLRVGVSRSSFALHPHPAGSPTYTSRNRSNRRSFSSWGVGGRLPFRLMKDPTGDGTDDYSEGVAELWSTVLHVSKEGNGSAEDQGTGIVHFNNAGSSPSPPPVLRAIASHLANEATLGGYLAANRASGDIDAVYDAIVRLVNAESAREIALVESATVAWTRVFYAMAERLAADAANVARTSGLGSGDTLERVVLISEAEYAANVVAILKFAREQNEKIATTNVRWRVLSLPSTTRKSADGVLHSTGVVDLNALDEMLSCRWALQGNNNDETESMLDPNSIAMVCVTHIPTNSGIINPVNDIGRRIRSFNNENATRQGDGAPTLPKILYVVDACQSAGQLMLDVQDMQCHALAATGRKYLRGPRGTGFLYVREDVANALAPSHIDHSAAPVVGVPTFVNAGATGDALPLCLDLTGGEGDKDSLQFRYKPGAARFEFWEASVSGRLGLGAAVLFALDAVEMQTIESRCVTLGAELRKRLRDIDRVAVHHDETEGWDDGSSIRQCGIVTFSVVGLDSDVVTERMLLPNPSIRKEGEDQCFELSVVPATSTPIDSARMSVGNLVRASLTYFNTESEIDRFCDKLQIVIRQT